MHHCVSRPLSKEQIKISGLEAKIKRLERDLEIVTKDRSTLIRAYLELKSGR
jgi:hypothetical protein